MINKEQIVFLAALGILALGVLALFTGSPGGDVLPVVPGEPGPNRDIEEPSVAAVFPPSMPAYARDPFAESHAWAPPRAGQLADLPAFPVAYAVPGVTLGEGGRVEIPSVQTEPPEEVAELDPDDEEDGEELENGEADDEGAGEE